MQAKELEKQKAIELRRNGKTYSEILQVIPVAKSTLSNWLREVGIAKEQKQHFTEKKRLSGLRGGKARRIQRLNKQKQIFDISKREIGKISDRELFLIGTTLYWAEGSKEKAKYPGSRVLFSNMDSSMIEVFLVWLKRIAKIPENMIAFDVYLHENHAFRAREVLPIGRKSQVLQIQRSTLFTLRKINQSRQIEKILVLKVILVL
ncbi:MAG: hypothetical protein RL641_771 [Candidatus Parcubacteria bacterium]|jgi:hypothetical protein